MILLKKDGFYKNGIELPFDMDFFYCWNDSINIDDNVNLIDIVNIIRSNVNAFRMLEKLTQSNILSHIQELSDVEPDNRYEYIIMGSFIDVCEFINQINYCSGYSNDEESKGECAIDFENWNNLKYLPIKISNETIISIYDGDETKKFKGDCYFTVGDFFSCLFGEICLFDSPEQREKKIDGLKKTIEGIENGTIKTYPWKEIKRK